MSTDSPRMSSQKSIRHKFSPQADDDAVCCCGKSKWYHEDQPRLHSACNCHLGHEAVPCGVHGFAGVISRQQRLVTLVCDYGRGPCADYVLRVPAGSVDIATSGYTDFVCKQCGGPMVAPGYGEVRP